MHLLMAIVRAEAQIFKNVESFHQYMTSIVLSRNEEITSVDL